MPSATQKKSTQKTSTRGSGSSRRTSGKVCSECHLGKGKHAPGCSKAGCQFCGAQSGHRPDCPEYSDMRTIEIVEGARYETADGLIVVVQRATKGSAGIVRYRSEDSDLEFTEKASRFRDIIVRRVGDDVVDVPAGPREVKTTVDGQDAQLVINGQTGEVISDKPKTKALVQVPLEQLVHELNVLDDEIDKVSSQRGAISNRLKLLKKQREEHIAEIKHRDPSSPGLFTSKASADDVDDDDDADDEE